MKWTPVHFALKRLTIMTSATTSPAHEPVAPTQAAPTAAPAIAVPTPPSGPPSADTIATLWADLDAFHRARQAQDQALALQSRQRFD